MKKIVIIDDVLPNALLLKGYASRLGDVETTTFTDPVEALEWCIANAPDLIMLDHVMPEMDGCEFLRRFRRLDHLKDVPVVMVTAQDGRETLYDALSAGANDFLRKPVDHVELLARARNMLDLRARQQELERANEQLYRLATTDPLTGLSNRRHFLRSLGDEIERCRRYRRPCSVAMVDADRFKLINDRYGHEAGDHVLEELARAFREVFRNVDWVGRIGGEEFAVRFPETPRDGGAMACERLLRRVRETEIGHGDIQIRVTVSVGITEIDGDGDDAGSVLRRADRALLRAKENGRDRVEVA